jgi:folylpolyglutamate synthase
MCESILRHHGYRTGFYSSPHLVAVRERIRLDGRVVSEEKFARHFHQLYDMLDETKVSYFFSSKESF